MTDVAIEAGAPVRSAVSVEEALRAFCESEYPALAAYCWRVTGDEYLAQDVAQEVVIRLFGRWTTVRDPRAYAYVLATNLIRGEWRSRYAERAALAKSVAAGDVEPPDLGVRDVVERLPRKWRDVVLLHYYADLSVVEVARVLELPPGTVKRRLSEARELLSRLLAGERP